MLSAGDWKLSQANQITFVIVDSSYTEITGLGTGFTLRLAKAGGSFADSAGTKAEIGEGGYRYTCTPAEADTIGPVLIKVTGAGAITQWLEYVVEQRTVSAIEFTYTVTNTATGNPLPGVQCWFCTDEAGTLSVWYGVTDAFGIARDSNGNKPRLDAGTYTIVRVRPGFTLENDTETVSDP